MIVNSATKTSGSGFAPMDYRKNDLYHSATFTLLKVVVNVIIKEINLNS